MKRGIRAIRVEKLRRLGSLAKIMKTHVRYLQEVKNGEGSKTDHLTMHSWVEVGRHYYTDDDLFKADDGKAGNYFSVFS